MAVPVAVVGAGPAGLATSCELTKAGVEHVVLERGQIGQTWRDRWDSFCLAPSRLPGETSVTTSSSGSCTRWSQGSGLDPPELEEPAPFEADAPEEVPLSDFGTVIFAGGFRPDYGSWLPWHRAFDDFGFPLHDGGESTMVPALYFVGVHFLRKRKSSTLLGVGEDASLVAGRIADALAG
jgi:Pyridine nucleotide-disulphide oxidoreductase